MTCDMADMKTWIVLKAKAKWLRLRMRWHLLQRWRLDMKIRLYEWWLEKLERLAALEESYRFMHEDDDD